MYDFSLADVSTATTGAVTGMSTASATSLSPAAFHKAGTARDRLASFASVSLRDWICLSRRSARTGGMVLDRDMPQVGLIVLIVAQQFALCR